MTPKIQNRPSQEKITEGSTFQETPYGAKRLQRRKLILSASYSFIDADGRLSGNNVAFMSTAMTDLWQGSSEMFRDFQRDSYNKTSFVFGVVLKKELRSSQKSQNHSLLLRNGSPLSNMLTLAILISPQKSPEITKMGVPKTNFPELPGARVLWKLYRNPEFPAGPSRFRILGCPFSGVRGKLKLICWAALRNGCQEIACRAVLRTIPPLRVAPLPRAGLLGFPGPTA